MGENILQKLAIEGESLTCVIAHHCIKYNVYKMNGILDWSV